VNHSDALPSVLAFDFVTLVLVSLVRQYVVMHFNSYKITFVSSHRSSRPEAGGSGFQIPVEAEISLLQNSRSALGPTPLPIRMKPELFLGGKELGA
jgi:hypothetical protein